MNELISVIIPVYNVEKYLKKCIDSIVNQTYNKLEIILVDDGSTDNSGKICDEYAKKDKRIKVIHKENGGLSDARNAGIEIATGEYIGFVDSDDYIEKDMYEYLYKILIQRKADISICNYEIFFKNEEVIIENHKDNIIEFDKKSAIKELIKNEIIFDYAWNKLYKRELFADIRYPVGKKFEDLGTTYKLFDKSNIIVIGQLKKYNYLQREDSIVHKKTAQLYIDRFGLRLERYYYVKNKYPDIIENDLDVIKSILGLYRLKIKEVDEYIENNKIEEIYNEIFKNKKNIIKNSTLKLKLKMLLFAMNKEIYRRI